jgi:hypothetical protein
MSATLKAKVAVSDDVQRDPRQLATIYDSMASKFEENGLDLEAVRAMGQYFSMGNDDDDENARPLSYSNFPAPLPPSAVRLSLVFFQQANPSLAVLVRQAASEIMATLPKSTKIHLNDPEHYHITIYMTSQPHTLRPNPFDPGAVLSPDITPGELFRQARPREDVVLREIDVIKKAAAETSPPTFRVHRVLMANSGTLLLCCVDVSGVIGALRARLREAFPGGPPKQSTIFHASVARILTPVQLSSEVIANMQNTTNKWSDRLRGTTFKVQAIHHVREEKFTTVEGPAVRLPFMGTDR